MHIMSKHLFSLKYIAAAILCMLLSNQSSAMGLGNITVSSHLNQPLNARVKLLNTRDISVEELTARLAKTIEFDRAGVQRFYFLTHLKFKIEKDKQDNIYVRINSTRSVKEPFLNFLLEVNWPQGRLLREYTVLMDLPVFTPEPVAELPTPPPQSPQMTKASPAQSQKVDSTAAPHATEEGYYHVGYNDNMWGIALKTRPDRTVSPQQAMLAIQKLNPKAFLYSNINLIKQQQKLKIPTLAQIQQFSKARALQLVAQQNRSFKDKSYKNKPAYAVAKVHEPEPSIHIVDKSVKGELHLIVPTTEELLEEPIDESKEESKEKDATALATINGQPRGISQSTPRNKEGLENELAISLEREALARNNNVNLKQRMQRMQEQLNKLEALLAIKNDKIAALQRGLKKDDKDAEQEKTEY